MDINALAVFNSMHRLGLTDQDFNFIAEEVLHRERTGLSVKCVKKGYCIGVSHDERHQIVIKKVRHPDADMTNTRILFKTLVKFDDLPNEIYILHKVAEYRSHDDDIRDVADNLEELKDIICDRFADDYSKKLGFDCYDYTGYNTTEEEKAEMKKTKNEIVKEQLKALFWLFGEDFETLELSEVRENIPTIIRVFQRNNRRVAIIQENEDYEERRGGLFCPKWTDHVKNLELRIKAFKPKDQCYNYACPSREIFEGSNSEIWIADDLLGKITEAELEVLDKRLDRNEGRAFTLLDADTYNGMKSSIRIELMSAKREEQDKKTNEMLCKKIESQFRQGKVARHGIEFSKKGMEYQGLIFRADRFEQFLSDMNILYLEHPVFSEICEGYFEWVLEIKKGFDYYGKEAEAEIGFKGKTNIQMGDKKIILYKESNSFYVKQEGGVRNRIKSCDLLDALKYSMRCPNADEYENFLNETSRVNLKLKDALNNGFLEFNLKMDSTDDNDLSKNYEDGSDRSFILLAIPMARNNGKNYAIIQGKEYRIKDINALFDLGRNIVGNTRNGHLQRSIRLLYKAIDGISPATIGEIIRQGNEEYMKMVRKMKAEEKLKIQNSKAFLENAMRLTNAEKVKDGYVVIGLSGMAYFVEKSGKVYTTKKQGEKFVNDKYLCIVDMETDDGTAWGMNDAIAKRLLALSKDSVVADEIYKNGDHMDKWWLQIAEKVVA